MSNAVDRIGLQNILDTFEMYDCPCFAIFQGSDMKFRYIGNSVEDAKEKLQQNLLGLHQYSTATYKVKMYDSPDGKGSINKSTPDCGSFTFKMHSNSEFEPAEERGLRAYRSSPGQSEDIQEMKQQIKDLTEALAAVNAEKEEEPTGVLGGIVDVLGKDNFNKLIFEGVGMLKGILGKALPGLNLGANTAHAISGIPEDVPQDQRLTIALQRMIGNDVEKANALSDAMYLLVERDPEFGNVLVKLSKMDSGTYNMAKGFLK